MSLRSRLTLFFVAIVLVPLIVVAVGLRGWLGRSLDDRTQTELAGDQRAAVGILRLRSGQAGEIARLLAADPALAAGLAAGDRNTLRATAARRAVGGFTVVVTDRAGKVLASAGPAPRFLPGFAPPSLQEALDAPAADPRRALFVREYVEVARAGCTSGCGLGRVVAGFWADTGELERLKAGPGDRDLTFAVYGRAVASTRPGVESEPLPVARADVQRVTLGGRPDVALCTAWLAPLPAEQAALVVSRPVEASAAPLRDLGWGLAVLVGIVALLVAVLGWLLARLVAEPLRDLAVGVRQIATGDFGRVTPRTRAPGEVGELARAFDRMRVQLGAHVDALRASRDELTRSMARVGETLASTNDLSKLLRVVLESAVQARQARTGSLLLFDEARANLVPEAVVGLEGKLGVIPAGTGIVGAVAASGRPTVLPGHGTAPAPAAGEPLAATQVSVPLRARGQVLGVLSVYDRDPGGPFTDDDARALIAFAGQAAAGIENVRLHEEARHLSMTDDLTGIWNRRYFLLRIEQEIERAKRFKRDLSVLLVDVDRFKQLNDRYGHQQGDAVLRELADRVSASIRDVDTFARYGGEEFVLILPETDVQGARSAAEKIRLEISARPFRALEAGAEPIGVTISVGVGCYPLHAGATDPLIAAADQAMYRAKSGGRDQVVIAEAPPGEPGYDPLPDRRGNREG
jgi:two-component system cell cycle response regulator